MIATLAPVSLYLDDMRANPYPGWVAARSAEEALGYFLTREIEHASLDHDLGACVVCASVFSEVETLGVRIRRASEFAAVVDDEHAASLERDRDRLVGQLRESNAWQVAMVSCDHAATGLDLVKWLAEHGAWPTKSMRVHSANAAGKAAMRALIEEKWPGPHEYRQRPSPLELATRAQAERVAEIRARLRGAK